MGAKLLAHLRGNVVGYVALCVAMTGSAAAAFHLPPGSVGTKQLKNGAVTGKKIAQHALTGANIKLSTLGTVPDSARLGGQPPSTFQARVTGSCSNGSAIAQIADSGAVSCQPSGAGTITGVSAGAGLSGGGSAGNVSLSLTPGYQLPQICSANELVKWTGSAWTCAAQGPASGPAGGALSGTYPNPSLNVSGGDNGASGCQGGEAVTGISSLAALTCAGVSPSGTAGGDLTGTYPSPSIAAGAVTTSKFATTAEVPNAAKLGGISPSGFIQGTGSVIDGHQLVPQNTTGITVLNPPTGFLVVDCNAGGSYDVFYVTNPSNPNQETWYSHSGGTVAYTLGGIAVFDSSATSNDLITVHTTDGAHPITMVIGAHPGTGAGPCLFSGQAIVQ